MEHTHLPDFSNHLILLNLRDTGAGEYSVSQCLLEYADWKGIRGRLFLVGRIPEADTTGWIAGRECGVAWDTVSSYILFKSREEYQASLARYKPTLRERLFR